MRYLRGPQVGSVRDSVPASPSGRTMNIITRAAILLCLLAAILQAQQSFETIQIIPKQDDSTTGEIRFREKWGSSSGQYVGLKAPSAIASNIVWVLPDHDGTANQCLVT